MDEVFQLPWGLNTSRRAALKAVALVGGLGSVYVVLTRAKVGAVLLGKPSRPQLFFTPQCHADLGKQPVHGLGLRDLRCWGCEGQAEPSGVACVPPEGCRGAQSPAQVSRGLPHTAGHPGLCGPGTAVLDQGGLPPLTSTHVPSCLARPMAGSTAPSLGLTIPLMMPFAHQFKQPCMSRQGLGVCNRK